MGIFGFMIANVYVGWLCMTFKPVPQVPSGITAEERCLYVPPFRWVVAQQYGVDGFIVIPVLQAFCVLFRFQYDSTHGTAGNIGYWHRLRIRRVTRIVQ